MKPLSGSIEANSQAAASKRGRRIQLPTELSDDDDDDDIVGSDDREDGRRSNNNSQQQSPPIVEKNRPGANAEAEATDEIVAASPPEVAVVVEPPPPPELVTVALPVSVPGPARFTRISKMNLSPGKKPVATIPTPQDTSQDDANEVKKMAIVIN